MNILDRAILRILGRGGPPTPVHPLEPVFSVLMAKSRVMRLESNLALAVGYLRYAMMAVDTVIEEEVDDKVREEFEAFRADANAFVNLMEHGGMMEDNSLKAIVQEERMH